MSNHTSARKVRLAIAATVAVASIGAGATAAVSLASAPAHSVSHDAGNPWPAPSVSPTQG